MGRTIEKIGTIEFERLSDTRTTDKYKIEFTGDDAPEPNEQYERCVNGRKIGCPDCKENTFAFFRGDEYHCSICLYSNDLSDDDIVRGILKEQVN